MRELQPTVFCTVPRLLNDESTTWRTPTWPAAALKSLIFNLALRKKTEEVDRAALSATTRMCASPPGAASRLVIVGSAPLAESVMRFARAAFGCPVMEGYGQSEATGGSTCTPPTCVSTGHVGVPLFQNAVMLQDVPEMDYFSRDGRGEVCVRGPNVTSGYFALPDKTAEAIDSAGWLHTGDIGEWLPGGLLRIIDRKKHLFKLAQGEYLAPEKIEQQCMPKRHRPGAHRHREDSAGSPEVAMTAACGSEEFKQAVMQEMLAAGKAAGLKSFEQVPRRHVCKLRDWGAAAFGGDGWSPPSLACSANYRSALDQAKQVDELLAEDASVIGAPAASQLALSLMNAIGAIPNLTAVSGPIVSVGIHPDDQVLTGLSWRFAADSDDSVLVDTHRLPFGARASCEIFHRLLAGIKRHMLSIGFTATVNYLDDWAVATDTEEAAQEALNSIILFELYWQNLGFRHLNTARKHLEKLARKLCWLSQINRLLRPFLRPLFDILSIQNGHRCCHLSLPHPSELRLWSSEFCCADGHRDGMSPRLRQLVAHRILTAVARVLLIIFGSEFSDWTLERILPAASNSCDVPSPLSLIVSAIVSRSCLATLTWTGVLVSSVQSSLSATRPRAALAWLSCVAGSASSEEPAVSAVRRPLSASHLRLLCSSNRVYVIRCPAL
uniref:long-chain-fatty-acid--CoA ligase n=1 Tax=Macrostomum lignano TaxID=282301 RepID=A0A1I8FML7_9PLAT